MNVTLQQYIIETKCLAKAICSTLLNAFYLTTMVQNSILEFIFMHFRLPCPAGWLACGIQPKMYNENKMRRQNGWSTMLSTIIIYVHV